MLRRPTLAWLPGAALCLTFVPAIAGAHGARGIQHIRPLDRTGLAVFEEPKRDTTPFSGLRLAIGGGFAQDFQNLSHTTRAEPNLVNGVDANTLTPIGPGFNTAMANLYLNVQMAQGIRVAMTAYLSSRNHNEAWVKDGYLLVDASPFDMALMNAVMQYLTLKVGHFEINYGDQHFRRTDGGNGLYNPFVKNTLYTGDRAGTHYFDVMDNAGNNGSGNINPKFVSNVQAVMVNPFLKLGGLEVMGTLERATGGASTENDRAWDQWAVDGVYRLWGERAYGAARYNKARGAYPGITTGEVGVNRVQVGGGLFITNNILGKIEYVQQRYQDFPTTDLRHGGEFRGVMVQGAVLF
ncbi:MAG: hypothetical protein H0X64_02640 [Gemmatimonadaceae bacterium]|nr:hypothetical protein [Gemmatimonadaceae bacterium]